MHPGILSEDVEKLTQSAQLVLPLLGAVVPVAQVEQLTAAYPVDAVPDKPTIYNLAVEEDLYNRTATNLEHRVAEASSRRYNSILVDMADI